MLLASVLVSFSPRDSRTVPHHGAHYTCVYLCYNIAWLLGTFSACWYGCVYVLLNAALNSQVLIFVLGGLCSCAGLDSCFSVCFVKKKKRHQQTTQPIYIHIWCDYMHIEGFVCTFFRESNPHKSIGRTKQHNTPHTTHSRRQNDKVFFVCWLCGRCGIIFHLRVENMLKTASKTKVKV